MVSLATTTLPTRTFPTPRAGSFGSCTGRLDNGHCSGTPRQTQPMNQLGAKELSTSATSTDIGASICVMAGTPGKISRDSKVGGATASVSTSGSRANTTLYGALL